MRKVIIKDPNKTEIFLIDLEEIIKKNLKFIDLKQILATKIGKFLGADRVCILEVDPVKGTFLTTDNEYLSDKSFKSLIGWSWEIASNKEVKDDFIKKMEIFYDPDLSKLVQQMKDVNPELAHFTNYYNIKAGMICPITKNEKLLGTINIHYGEIIEESNPQIMDFLKKLADILADIYPHRDVNQNNFIFIKNDLAKIFGLSASVTYNALVNSYNYYKNLSKIDKNSFCLLNFDEIKSLTYLSDLDIKLAINKLNEFSLIDIKKNDNKSFHFKILNDDNFIDFNFSERKYKLIEEHFKNKGIEPTKIAIEDIYTVINTFCNDEYLKIVKYFFNEIEKKLRIKLSNLDLHIFYSTYHIFSTYLDKYNLDFDTAKSVIDFIFKGIKTNKSKIIDLKQPTHILSNRLKLMLFYNFNNLNYEYDGIRFDSVLAEL